MPDKDIMALIEKRQKDRPWAVLDALGGEPPYEDVSPLNLGEALRLLADDWRATAELYDRAKLKGAKTLYIDPLRHAAAELDKVIKALAEPRRTDVTLSSSARCPGCVTATTEMPPHDWICGPGNTTARCLGREAPRDLTSLDALIADAKAEGRGTLRTVLDGAGVPQSVRDVCDTCKTLVKAPGSNVCEDCERRAALGAPDSAVAAPETFPGQATDAEVIAYLKGEAHDIPGSPPLTPNSVRSIAELKAEARAALDPEGMQRAAPAAPENDLGVFGVDDREESLTVQPHPQFTSTPPLGGGPAVPSTWANASTTPDGHRITGSPIPTPLLGQPGDAGSGYSPTYVPPNGVPMTYAELLTPVPYAILPPHLSHSQIDTIKQCPTKYRAQRLDRIHSGPDGAGRAAPVTQIPEWALIGGKAFHSFVEAWECAAASGVKLAGLGGEPFTDDDARYEWETAFAREIELVESSSPVPRGNWRASKQGAEGETWWNANGPLMLKRYVEARRPDEWTWSMPSATLGASDLALELERIVSVPGPYGDLPYRAILDRVRVRQVDGDPWITLVIDDYKTGDRMPSDTSQLGEYANVLRLLGVPPQVKIFGRFFNARKGTWTSEVDLEGAEGWSAEWFSFHVHSGHAERLALTAGPTPVRSSSFCGGCSVRWACPVKGVKRG